MVAWRSPSRKGPCGGDLGGARLRLPIRHSAAVDLFGESPSRLVVTARSRYLPAVELLARQHGLPFERLGHVVGDRLVVDLVAAGATGSAEDRGSRIADALDVRVADLRHAWTHGLERALGWDALAAPEQSGVA